MKKFHTDRIAVMPDDELNSNVSKIKNQLTYRNQKDNRENLEIELCYLQREVFIRSLRKKAHEDFLKAKGFRRREQSEKRK
tara:strand:- start:648 stop:890 length:243 start_codon:yes stop_codon:yes gene_type:complete